MSSLNSVKGYVSISGVPSIDPAKLKVITGYNVRDTFNPSGDDDDKALFASIAANGFMSDKPVTVRIIDNEAYVIAGHRRLAAVLAFNAQQRAVKLPGIKGIAILPEAKGAAGTRDNAEATLDILVSNSGKPLSQLEKGAAYARLVSYGWAIKDIATRAAVTPKWIAESMKAARLDPRLKALIKAGIVSPTLALETVAKHGDKAPAIVTEAAKRGTGANAGKATGKTIAAVTGVAAKNAKSKPSPAVIVTVAAAKTLPGNKGTVSVLHGPFHLGTGLDERVMYDAQETPAILCEWPDVGTAKAMLMVCNQGWHTLRGAAVTSGKAEAKPQPAKAEAKPQPAKAEAEREAKANADRVAAEAAREARETARTARVAAQVSKVAEAREANHKATQEAARDMAKGKATVPAVIAKTETNKARGKRAGVTTH